MLVSNKLIAGQPGTKRIVTQYGARLVCARYRYDANQCERFKTVELIIEESDWQPPVKPILGGEIVGLRVGLEETTRRTTCIGRSLSGRFVEGSVAIRTAELIVRRYL
jgi:hypothetical protein